MKVDPGFADKERMAGRSLAKILIQCERIVDGPGCQLAVKTELRINIRIQVQPQSITHARVLLMGKRRKTHGRRRVSFAEDAVKAEPKIAAEAERTDL